LISTVVILMKQSGPEKNVTELIRQIPGSLTNRIWQAPSPEDYSITTR
jgi:hypothetical protein